MYECFSYLYVCALVCALCTCSDHRGQRGIGLPRTGVINSCELLCEFWELSQGPLKDQPVL